MDGLHRFVYGGQLLLKGLIDLRLAVDKISQGRLVRIEKNLNFHYLLGSMGVVDSTPDLLVDETHCCH